MDWYGKYPGGSVTDPKGIKSESKRVMRGGFWGIHASWCYSAKRNRMDPSDKSRNSGFRPVLSQKSKP